MAELHLLFVAAAGDPEQALYAWITLWAGQGRPVLSVPVPIGRGSIINPTSNSEAATSVRNRCRQYATGSG